VRLRRRTVLAAAPLLASKARAQRGNAANSQAPRDDDAPAPGWRRDVLIRWGDRVEFDAPAFDPHNPTDIAAATQFGWDASVLAAVPGLPGADGSSRLVLAVAHPGAEARMMFPGGRDRPLLAGLAQGASMLDLERRNGSWMVAEGGFQARRLTARTLCRLAGPATRKLGESAQGVLAIGGGCATPWGTVLMAEGDPAPWLARLGKADPMYADPAVRALFGWMVEFDPLDMAALPVKRTALGRLARVGAAATLADDGRAVVFMTDARPLGFLFRFVSAAPAAPGGNRGLLDNGTLSVARADGTGLRFVDLPPARATSLDAAAAAGAIAFDAPGGLTIGEDRTLNLACRGNPLRANPDALNPRTRNAGGHVLGLRPRGGDAAATEWSSDIVLLGGNPAEGGGVYPEGSQAWLAAPQALARDAAGRLWIGTDQGGALSPTADGVFVTAPSGNALGAAYFAPRGAAIGGAVAVDGTLFVAVRHPGAEQGASFDRPGTVWPGLRPGLPPQSALVSLTRTGG
jgi:secreted PhoX family phosphatase